MENPFARIALSLSGGGFRASAFALGALKLLDEAGLLKNVHMLSTVSGGTLTGAFYAVYAKKKGVPRDIFATLYNTLKKDEIINSALNILENRGVFVPSKRQNLICSFAEAYDLEFFHNEKFGVFWKNEKQGCLNETEFHLKEIIFNATDFESGIAFRFWKSMGSPRIGNRYNHITREQAKKMRLADILAASACFPAGFEPIAMPGDFKWDNNEIYRSIKKTLNGIDVPLMDGGVYDNQGLDSLLMADKNNQNYLEANADKPEKIKNRRESTLFLIVDVAGAERNFFKMPDSGNNDIDAPSLENKYTEIKSQIETFFTIKPVILPFFITLTAAMAGLGIWSIFDESIPWGFVFCFAPLAVLFAAAFIFLKFLLNKIDGVKCKYYTDVQPEINKLEKKYPDISREAKEAFGKLSLNRIIDMLEIRVKSLMAMTGGIFMKRIRSHGFSGIFSNEKLEKKCAASIITDLTKPDAPSVPAFLKSDHLRKIARNASGMPTTLWFKSEKERLKNLVASGRFTLCYNLLKYISNTLDDPRQPREIEKVKERLTVIWENIKKNPFYDIEN